jgi:vancomycin resistance protein YoaR
MKFKLYLALIVILFGISFVGIQTWESFRIAPHINYADRSSFTAASELSAQLTTNKDREYKLRIQEQEISLKGDVLASLIEPYIRNFTQKKEYRISQKRMNEILVEIAQSINSAPIDARITLIKGIPTTLFEGIPGIKLSMDKSAKSILDGIIQSRPVIYLIVDYVEPGLTLAKFEKLNIKDLLAEGESDFAGSSSSRIHNITVSAARYNGLLIPPGKTFSFNELLGEVSAKSGYLPELVIKNKKIVPEYGGGICQVSSTLYKAALRAGLEIVERRGHSVTIRYYSPQGLDATIYPGVVDLKFKNDTNEYILIQSKIEGTKLTFEIYGENDGREVTINGPHMYPREEGGWSTYVTRTIKKGRKETEESFDSVYKSIEEYPLERNPLE